MPAAGRLNRRKSQLNLPDPVPWSQPQTYRPAGRDSVAGKNLESLPATISGKKPGFQITGQLDLARRIWMPASWIWSVARGSGPPRIGSKTAEIRQKSAIREPPPAPWLALARAMFLSNIYVKNGMNVSRETLPKY